MLAFPKRGNEGNSDDANDEAAESGDQDFDGKAQNDRMAADKNNGCGMAPMAWHEGASRSGQLDW